MRVLVTGAAGFIGGALASRLLRDGHLVTALVRDGDPPVGCRVLRGDLRDLQAIERAVARHGPEAVFHLAAQAIVPYARRDPWSTMEDNVRGTYNLLEAFRRHSLSGATLVVASSDKSYGDMPPVGHGESRAYRESDPMAGRGPYDASKSCADLLARSYADEYGLRLAVVRCGNVYGPGDVHPTRLVPSVVRDIVDHVVVHITSDGTPVRDYLYVDDAVEAYLAVEEYLRGLSYERAVNREPFPPLRAFNFAGGEPTSVRTVVGLALEVAAELDLPPAHRVVFHDVRRGEIREQVLNWTLASSLLGWMPQVTLRDGLRRTLLAALGRSEGQGSLQGDQPGGLCPPPPHQGNTPGGTAGGL